MCGVAYYAQTLPADAQTSELTFASPPGMQAVELPACDAYAREKSCPLERFVEIAKPAIEPGCVTIKP